MLRATNISLTLPADEPLGVPVFFGSFQQQLSLKRKPPFLLGSLPNNPRKIPSLKSNKHDTPENKRTSPDETWVPFTGIFECEPCSSGSTSALSNTASSPDTARETEPCGMPALACFHETKLGRSHRNLPKTGKKLVSCFSSTVHRSDVHDSRALVAQVSDEVGAQSLHGGPTFLRKTRCALLQLFVSLLSNP